MDRKKEKRDNSYCCVPQCYSKGSRNPDISFHKFPNVGSKIRKSYDGRQTVFVSRMQEWIRLLKIGKSVSRRMVVCSNHFKNDDYFLKSSCVQRPRLKSTALPSLCLPVRSTDDLSKNSLRLLAAEKRKARYENIKRLLNLHLDNMSSKDKDVSCFSVDGVVAEMVIDIDDGDKACTEDMTGEDTPQNKSGKKDTKVAKEKDTNKDSNEKKSAISEKKTDSDDEKDTGYSEGKDKESDDKKSKKKASKPSSVKSDDVLSDAGSSKSLKKGTKRKADEHSDDGGNEENSTQTRYPEIKGSDQRIIDFIKLYESEETLWNVYHLGYADYHLFYDSWRRIQLALNTTLNIHQLETKMNDLISSYKKRVAAINLQKDKGDVPNIPIPGWHEEMARFYPKIPVKRNYDTPNAEETSKSAEQAEKSDVSLISGKTVAETYTIRKKKKTTAHDKYIKDIHTQFKSVFDILNTVIKKPPPDACETFGQILTKKLKAFDETTRDVAMLEINRLMFQLEHTNFSFLANGSNETVTPCTSGELQTSNQDQHEIDSTRKSVSFPFPNRCCILDDHPCTFPPTDDEEIETKPIPFLEDNSAENNCPSTSVQDEIIASDYVKVKCFSDNDKIHESDHVPLVTDCSALKKFPSNSAMHEIRELTHVPLLKESSTSDIFPCSSTNESIHELNCASLQSDNFQL